MARVDEPFTIPRKITPFRLFVIVLFLGGIVFTGGYLILTPLTHLYWGVYARAKPMISASDLQRQGKSVPRKMVDDSSLEDLPDDDELFDPDLFEDSSADDIQDEGQLDDESDQHQQQVDDEEDELDNLFGEDEVENQVQRQEQKKEEVKPAVEQQPKQSDKTPSPYALTRELAEKAAGGPGGVVVLTWANFHYRDFVFNWVHHLKATGCTNYLVGAMDDALLNLLIEKGVPCFGMQSGLSTEDFGWGSPQFNKMGREKINLIHVFTKMGVDVFVSDVDAVWMRNPIDYVAKYPEADILTSSDGLTSSVQDESLEIHERQGSAANIGLMLFRKKAVKLTEEWMKVLQSDDKIWDQNAFNDLFRRGWTIAKNRTDNLFYGYDNTLLIGILPVSVFCSGHTFFVQRMPDTMGLKPYVAHATFQYSGTEGKRNRFRERNLWIDDDSYFQLPNGFVQSANKIPARLLAPAKNFTRDGTIATADRVNMRLVHYQLRTLRALFGISIILERGVVLPEFWCGMDRWWAGHTSTIPGSEFDLPFSCPADHVLSLDVMDRELDPNRYGPYIPWREYSFLEKPKAKALVESKLTVVTCKAGEAGCVDGAGGEVAVKNNVVRLQGDMDEVKLGQVLKPLAQKYKVLFFEDPASLWTGFTDAKKANMFTERMNLYSSIWCCVPDHHPGHIWYDFFWDVIPHKDRHNREITTKWKATVGP